MTRKTGTHLTRDERCQIYTLLQSGKSYRAIAEFLGVHHTTISRELKRNKGERGYRFKQADRLSETRRGTASQAPKRMTEDVISMVLHMLTQTQSSPGQISGRLGLEGIKISPESIYKYIWKDKLQGGLLYLFLRHKAKKYNKRSGKNAGRGCIPNRVDISERPKEVEEKRRFGDFELDTIVGLGHKGAIVSIVDRASKYTFLKRVLRRTAANVSKALYICLKPLSDLQCVRTLTSDNGKEFAGHIDVALKLGASFYFATPYHSWERGLNEHTNGLVRQYFPKGTDFDTLTDEDVALVEWKINNRPRAIINFMTPTEKVLSLVPNFSPGAFRG